MTVRQQHSASHTFSISVSSTSEDVLPFAIRSNRRNVATFNVFNHLKLRLPRKVRRRDDSEALLEPTLKPDASAALLPNVGLIKPPGAPKGAERDELDPDACGCKGIDELPKDGADVVPETFPPNENPPNAGPVPTDPNVAGPANGLPDTNGAALDVSNDA